MKSFDVLIVVYKRPTNLLKVVNFFRNHGYKINLYVDHDDQSSAENLEVKQLALELADAGFAITKINQKNIGVGRAVPEAIDWALQHSSKLLILEDDCEPELSAIEFFEGTHLYIDGRIKMISGRSPWPESEALKSPRMLTVTNFPLSNGWMVSRESWEEISVYYKNGVDHLEIAHALVKSPKNILVISFFVAACLSNAHLERKAWDCYVVLRMVAKGFYSASPDFTCISTYGIDAVASNTKGSESTQNQRVVVGSQIKPSMKLDTTQEFITQNNQQIMKNIYGISFRHLLSPAKVLFKTFLYRFRCWSATSSQSR